MSGTYPVGPIRLTVPTQRVLQAFLDNPGEMYGRQVGELVGYPNGTIHSVLNRLVGHGVLSSRMEDTDTATAAGRHPRRFYSLTPDGAERARLTLQKARISVEPPTPPTPAAYDSTGDTLRHSLRVGQLIAQILAELTHRAVTHDLSKVEPPERNLFDQYTPALKDTTFGSPQYYANLRALGPALRHHYAHNRHHPEHYDTGVRGMNLVDVLEMLADWRASTERHDDGSMVRSLRVQQDRYGLDDQLADILWNTARDFGWLDTVTCGQTHVTDDGAAVACTLLVDRREGHGGRHRDNSQPQPVEW